MKLERVARLDDLSEGKVQVHPLAPGRRLALLRLHGEVFAFSDHCTHEEASLAEGFLDGYTVECPRHGASFDVRTGKVLALPATRDRPTYPVRVQGGEVWVGLAGDQDDKEE